MFTIEAILEDNLRKCDIATTNVLVAGVVERKKLSNIVSILKQHLPLSRFALSHLKRIRSKNDSCQIILAPILSDEDGSNTDLGIGLIEKSLAQYGDVLQKLLSQHQLQDVQMCRVPSSLPLTRQQFEAALKLWPVNYHENKYLSKCLDGTLFSADQMKRINQWMQKTVDLSTSHSVLHKSDHLCSLRPCRAMAALIVKDNYRQLVSSAVSDTDHNPVRHAVMVVIDKVAEIQRAAKAAAAAARENDDDDRKSERERHMQEDYLCVNYECFLSQDPCIMCAMALVHSRIKRVFFFTHTDWTPCWECNDFAYQVHKLHVLPKLNHHYEVWQLSPIESESYQSNETCPVLNKKVKI